MPDRRQSRSQDRVAVAEGRDQGADGRHDQHPVGHVADAGAGPVAERGEEPEVLAEAGLRVGVDARRRGRACARRGSGRRRRASACRCRRSVQAIRAPATPVSCAKRSGSEKTPAPDHGADDHRRHRGEGELLCGGLLRAGVRARHALFLPAQPASRASVPNAQITTASRTINVSAQSGTMGK